MAVQQVELPEIVEWRAELGRLYARLRSWLAELSPPPTVEATSTKIIEKRSGEYEAPALLVRRGDGEFRVEPIARWVVGASGRVDLIGGDGPFILVREVQKGAVVHREGGPMIEVQDIDDWFWVQDHEPWDRVQLTGELFRELAEACLE